MPTRAGLIKRPVAFICPAGFERLAERAAAAELRGFVTTAIGGGFILGETSDSVDALRRFPCVSNSFAVVFSVDRRDLADDLAAVSRGLRGARWPTGLSQKGTIRLRVHSDGEFASTSSAAARLAEAAIGSWSGLRVMRAGAHLECWLIRRSDMNRSVLALKLTPQASERLRKGSLSRPIASCLARVCRVDAKSVVLDPFCGAGAIGRACLAAGAGRVWLNDIALDLDGDLSDTVDPRLRVSSCDVRDLPVAPSSISLIVTDPPWGQFDRCVDVVDLYRDFGQRRQAHARNRRPRCNAERSTR